jgi:hypothetical protein
MIAKKTFGYVRSVMTKVKTLSTQGHSKFLSCSPMKDKADLPQAMN